MVLFAACRPQQDHLIILHTNDTHSQVEPFGTDADEPFTGRGGYVRRVQLLDEIRAAAGDTAMLLLDAGDFCQGTPYFNLYHGRVELQAMNAMGYDAATLGNHEFDNGVDTLAAVLRTAQFPIVCANYDVTGTPLEGLVKPYVVVERGGLKIGIFGMGVNPYQLIDTKNFKGVSYLDPVETARRMIDQLKGELHCDLVVMLSHLGYENTITNAGDEVVLANTHGIDAVVGGHTHKLVTTHVTDLNGDTIPVGQMRKSGIFLGRIDLHL
ncbi:MAG: bifunctional metallophosphatase/5'-nucleotidase [Paludibacteraceae bacterium]|nr:bifunctional metallophosphatase/5'-nucleotidase [Paludibacteraceae bacterium]